MFDVQSTEALASDWQKAIFRFPFNLLGRVRLQCQMADRGGEISRGQMHFW